ncbi:MAG: IPT/TIG domain-containing protein [Vicinamibacteria bacterium]|nr:IPT/TIG domain-containing protein [Vicinamibacteria bacterium]
MADSPSESSLQILGGALNGQRYVFPLAADEVTIGADPGCSFVLEAPGVSPLHARLIHEAGGWVVHDCRAPQGLYLNDSPVGESAPLTDGDFLWLGEPGGDDAVMVQVRLASEAAPVFEEAPVEAEPEMDLEEAPLEEAPQEAAFEAAPQFEEAPADAPLAMESESAGFDVPPEDEPLDLAPEPEAAPAPPAPVPMPPPAPAPAPAPAPPPPASAAPAPKKIQKHDTSGIGWEAPERTTPPGPPLPPTPAPAPRPAPAPPPAARAGRKRGGTSPALLGGGVAALLALAAGGWYAWGLMKAPKAASLSPTRAAAGQVVALTGENFAPDAAGNVVKVGTTSARVTSATATRIEFELPAVSGAAGQDQKLAVTVDVGGRVSNPVDLAVYQRPRIKSITPDVAQSGDVVTLAGDGWAAGAEVRFGTVKAEEVALEGKALKVTVPALEAASGAAVPVTVAMGKDASAPANLLFGRLPLVIQRTPAAAQPGQVVTLKGRGFKPGETRVTLAGVPALLLSVKDDEIQMVTPRQDSDGEAALQVTVAGLEPASGGALTVSQGPGGLLWRVVPEPLGPDAEGKQTAALATTFGPTFVLSSVGPQSAAQRALEAQKRFAAAGEVLTSVPGLDVQARNLKQTPQVGLAGRAEVLLEPADEDVAYYAQDSKGAAVTKARLAVWWAALAQDLVLATMRQDVPRHAAALGPEGRALVDAQKLLAAGATPLSGLARLRDGLRAVGTRVPAGVKDATAVAAAATEEAPLVLDGDWRGKEVEKGAPKYVTVTFKTRGSNLAYQTGVSMSTPIRKYEVRKGNRVYFLIGAGNKLRHYIGSWDGKKITGKIAANENGTGEIGTFELTRQ